MEKFPEVSRPKITGTDKSNRLVVNLPLPAYLKDHRFMGKAVYPAVEAMQTLASLGAAHYPHIDVGHMTAIHFNKFLPLPFEKGTIPVLVETVATGPNRLTLALMTKKRLKKSGMSRLLTHATVSFDVKPKDDSVKTEKDLNTRGGTIEKPADDKYTLSTNQVYQALVPFGPAYQNLTEDLIISKTGAAAKIKAPDIHSPGPLGSPFPLDAAFHAACVWGQRYVGIVAFPVGIDTRRVVAPTIAGEDYLARIIAVQAASGRLMVDIWLYDGNEGLRETVFGVEMQDVSNGRLKPPDWIRSTGDNQPETHHLFKK